MNDQTINIGTKSAYMRFGSGMAMLAWGTVRMIRKPDEMAGPLLVLFGACKAAEGVARYCPMKEMMNGGAESLMQPNVSGGTLPKVSPADGSGSGSSSGDTGSIIQAFLQGGNDGASGQGSGQGSNPNQGSKPSQTGSNSGQNAQSGQPSNSGQSSKSGQNSNSAQSSNSGQSGKQGQGSGKNDSSSAKKNDPMQSI
ncbi:YgaP-like transmembrane domain [Edaphobacillus lindanitolerans]|nr:YgaP-like transmembrane domain [Edaphobacillus lindanitolerans]